MFFEKQDNDKLIYEQKKVHVFMLYFIDVDQGKEYTNSCRREIENMEVNDMKKPVLVIMAAGMGSRYGGLKQIDPVDEDGHIIIDFQFMMQKSRI